MAFLMGFQKSRPYACEDRLLHAVFLKDYDVRVYVFGLICIFVYLYVYVCTPGRDNLILFA